MEKKVVIVGAGPAGLATAACLGLHSIPHVILEKEDCCASLWKRRAYDRLRLHLPKRLCALPHMPFPATAPTFMPKEDFLRYVDRYVEHFQLSPTYSTRVEAASYDERSRTWRIVAYRMATDKLEIYTAKFLVVATGENGEGLIPHIPGIKSFPGQTIHSSCYKTGAAYAGKNVLVVGAGNSGMEIAYDLCNHGAKTSIAIRSPLHVTTKELISVGMALARYLPFGLVDSLLLMLAKFKYGNLSKYGLTRSKMGPFCLKATTGRSPVIDVGTVEKIKSGEIQVVKGLSSIRGNEVVFLDGKSCQFDDIIFATGYASAVNKWLQDDGGLFREDGFPKQRFPNHWKGANGLYCVGFAGRGLQGVSYDAQNVADDIKNNL